MVAEELCTALDSTAEDDSTADDVGATEEEAALVGSVVGSAAEEVDELGSTTGGVVVGTVADEASAISS